jgi:Zn-finger nucleic acid-binding protein
MEFAGSLEGEEIQVELKYCERCGGLWLRAQGTNGIYCVSCCAWLAAARSPARQPLRSRKPWRRKEREPQQSKGVGSERGQNLSEIDYLQGVAATEVGA